MRFGRPRKAKTLLLKIVYAGPEELETILQVFWRFGRKMKWVKDWTIALFGEDAPLKRTLAKMAASWRKSKWVSHYLIRHNDDRIKEYWIKS